MGMASLNCTGNRMGGALLLSLVLLVIPGRPVRAQILPTAAGAMGGLAAGAIVTTATVVLEARLGRYLYSFDDLVAIRFETIPVLIGPVAGAVLGARSPSALGRAGTGALVGMTGGIAIGVAAGSLASSTSEGRWAGGIIGGAAGMVTGAVLYATLGGGDEGAAPGVTASFSIPVPWGRR